MRALTPAISLTASVLLILSVATPSSLSLMSLMLLM